MHNHLETIAVSKKPISWPTVRYMLGEVQFGGRVTDDYDKRLLNTFAKVWFADKLFNSSFEFFSGYKVCRFKNQDEYVNALDELESVDPPQV